MLRGAFADVKMVLHNMTKEAQIEALWQRRIDVGFNRPIAPLSDIANEIVTTEKILLAVNENHALARQATIPFRVLADHPLIVFPSGPRPSFVDKVMSLCQQMGFTPHVAATR